MQAGLLKDIIEFEKRELITNEFNEQMIEYHKCLTTKHKLNIQTVHVRLKMMKWL